MLLIAGLTLAALGTSTLSSVAGMGGGTILIALFYAVGLVPAVAVPLHAGVQLVANASRSLAYAPHIVRSGLGLFLLGAVPAPFIVAPLVLNADPDWIRLIMAVFIILAIWPRWASSLRLHGPVALVIAGVISGGVGMIVGATGVLMAPFFVRDDWTREQIVATMAATAACAHALKLAAFSVYGFAFLAKLDWFLPMAAAVIAGSFLGRYLVGLFSERHFRIVFRSILLVLASKLAFDGLVGIFA